MSAPDSSKPIYAIVLAETGQIKLWDGDLGGEYLAVDEDRQRLELICDASRGEVIKEFIPEPFSKDWSDTVKEVLALRQRVRELESHASGHQCKYPDCPGGGM